MDWPIVRLVGIAWALLYLYIYQINCIVSTFLCVQQRSSRVMYLMQGCLVSASGWAETHPASRCIAPWFAS